MMHYNTSLNFPIFNSKIASVVANNHVVSNRFPLVRFEKSISDITITAKRLFTDSPSYSQISVSFFKGR